MRLNKSSLANLPRDVVVAAYDRSRLTVGIVHMGDGSFHRAHPARYADELLCLGQDHDFAVAENDPIWADLHARALAARDRPEQRLEMRLIYGELINTLASLTRSSVGCAGSTPTAPRLRSRRTWDEQKDKLNSR